MLSKCTLLLQNTTTPANRSDASPHTAGWSESFWRNGVVAGDDLALVNLITKRARLLPNQASIVGFRISLWDISGNKLLARGSSTAKTQRIGHASLTCTQPGTSLSFSGSSSGVANSSRFALKCLPDEEETNGEYQPDTAYKTAVTQFCNEMTTGWGFVGRDLTKVSQKVITIAGNIVKLAGLIGAAPGVDNLIFKKVKADNGDPVKGSYLVTNVTVANEYTLAAFPGAVVTKANGLARVDAIAFYPYTVVVPDRSVTRKVGRPFAAYRGRASKRAA